MTLRAYRVFREVGYNADCKTVTLKGSQNWRLGSHPDGRHMVKALSVDTVFKETVHLD